MNKSECRGQGRRYRKKIIAGSLIILFLVGGLQAQTTAQQDDAIAALAAKIAQKDKDFPTDIEKLADIYFGKNDYDGFYGYLKGLLKKGYAKFPEVYFYLARTRQQQLQYWQKSKNWEGVYNQAEGLKKDIAENLDKAEKFAKDNSEVLLGIKYLRWRNTKDEDPDKGIGLFNDLVNAAKQTGVLESSLEKIKAMADELSGFEDKNLSRRLYEIYAAKLTSSNLPKEELKIKGEGFLTAGNVYLAKSLFDCYISKFSEDKETQAKELVGLADKFIHTGWQEGVDPFYAETLYQKAYDLAAEKAFDSGSQYRRAFNLERVKEYERAIEEYKNFLHRYADDSQRPKILFRLGVLTAYAKKDRITAQDYFLKAKNEFLGGPIASSSLYQLGLLSQWANEDEKAKEYYNAFLETAKTQGLDLQKNELALLTQERLSEIEEKKELRYSLKLFLQETFGGQGAGVMTDAVPLPGGISVDLTGRPSKQNINKPVTFVVTTSNPQTGCMTPNYSYEWSGEVGGMANIPNSPELPTQFDSVGIKVTHVAVVGPDGPQGVAFEMTEIEQGTEGRVQGTENQKQNPEP